MALIFSTLVAAVRFSPDRLLNAVPVVIGFPAGAALRLWADGVDPLNH